MPIIRAARTACAAVAVAVLGAGVKTIPEHPAVGLTMCAIAVIFGLVVTLLWVKDMRRFRRIRDGLGARLSAAHELKNRISKSAEEFERWKADLDRWYRDVQQYLGANLSRTHTELFVTITDAASYSIHPSFSQEHIQLLNVLRVYTANLRSITERFLTTHD